MIVVDASSFVDFATQAKFVPELVFAIQNATAICAPTLVDYEFYNVLRKHVLSNRLTADVAVEAIKLYNDIPILKFECDLLVERIWELRDNMTARRIIVTSLQC